MDYYYITEEAVFARNAQYHTPEFEQEQKILDALRVHFAKLLADSLEKVREEDDLRCVEIGDFEIKIMEDGRHFKAVYRTVYDDHVGLALEELSKMDSTNCLTLRVVKEYPDPSAAPALAKKTPGDQCVNFEYDLWDQAVAVRETKENWKGDLTCSMQLPGYTAVPDELVKAWKKIEDKYTTSKGILIEEQLEEYEGSMTGGAFITFDVKGAELPDLLDQLQALNDACQKLGGDWMTEGYLYSDFAVLSFDTNQEGKVIAEYLAL